MVIEGNLSGASRNPRVHPYPNFDDLERVEKLKFLQDLITQLHNMKTDIAKETDKILGLRSIRGH